MSADCRQVHDAIRARRSLDSDERAHTLGCGACAELVDGLGALLITGDPARSNTDTNTDADTARFEALFRSLEPDLERANLATRVRAQSTPRRIAALAIFVAGCLAMVGLTMARFDLALVPLPRMLTSVLALAIGLSLAGLLTLRPLYRGPRLGGWDGVAALTLCAAVPAVIALLPPAHDHPASALGVGDDFIPEALSCFGFGFSLTALMFGVVWVLSRDALASPRRAALAALAGATFGNLALILHCGLVMPVHKLAGHLSVTVAAGLAASIPLVLSSIRAVRSRRSK